MSQDNSRTPREGVLSPSKLFGARKQSHAVGSFKPVWDNSTTVSTTNKRSSLGGLRPSLDSEKPRSRRILLAEHLTPKLQGEGGLDLAGKQVGSSMTFSPSKLTLSPFLRS